MLLRPSTRTVTTGMRRARLVSALVLAGVVLSGVALSACDPGARGHRAGPAGADTPTWRRAVTGWPSNLVTDGRGSVVLSGDTTVTALDTRGRVRWAVNVDGAGRELGDPAVDRARVLVGAGDRLVALDRARGAVRWRVDVPVEVGAVAWAHPDGSAALALDATFAGDLEARDGRTGAPRWTIHEDGEVRSPPALGRGEGTVVALWSPTDGSQRSTLRALDVVSGQVLWEQDLPAYASAPLVTHGLVVLGVGDGEAHAEVRAFALPDGTPAWRSPVPASFEPELEPADAAGSVLVVDQLGTVSALDTGSGVRRWQRALGTAVLRGRPIVGERLLAVATAAGEVVRLDRRTGRVVGRLVPSAFPAALAGGKGRLLVALRRTEPGRVEAYGL